MKFNFNGRASDESKGLTNSELRARHVTFLKLKESLGLAAIGSTVVAIGASISEGPQSTVGKIGSAATVVLGVMFTSTVTEDADVVRVLNERGVKYY